MTLDHVPGTERCGCCSGVEPRTPKQVWNRPGLPAISYRSGTHGDVRASLISALTDHTRPTLGRLRTRADDDLTIALLDAWAVASDILTFYNERLANESYLGTAIERTSLQELGRLVGHRLDPGVAAQTHLAFTIERPPPTAGLSDEPGLAPPVLPAEIALGPGLRVQSIPGPGETPKTFETVEATIGRPGWNALPVRRTAPWAPTMGLRHAHLDGVGLNLRPGDAFLLASPDLVNDRWDVRVLVSVDEDLSAGRTRVTWDRGLGSFDPVNHPADVPDAFALRRRIPIHGHNAPVWAAMNSDFRTGYVKEHGGSATGTQWPSFAAVRTITSAGASSEVEVLLSGAATDVVAGSWVVVSQESGTSFYRELYEVLESSQGSSSRFGVSGPITRLRLRGEPHTFLTPRDVVVLAVAEPLVLVDGPDASAVTGQEVDVDGDATDMAPGRALIVKGTTTSGEPTAWVGTLQEASAMAGGRTRLRFTAALPGPLQRSTAVVLGNVALATHGETVTQVLGDGDGRRAHQAFPLRQGPLTFVQAANKTGAASTLTVRVEDVAWRDQPTLFAAGSTDRVHTTRDEPDGPTSVVFGDGVRGRRLPSGSLNVRAEYRTGLGAAGNVAPGALALPMDRPLGLKAVTNPIAAEGGADPEDEREARRTIPLPVRTLGRAVSLRDYADFALAFAGVGVADATAVPLPSGRAIVVTIGDVERRPAPVSTAASLTAALRSLGDPYVDVRVLPLRAASFRLALKVLVLEDHDPSLVLEAVEQALRTRYAPVARQLGQPLHRSEVIATAAAVRGVAAIDLDRLHRTGSPIELRTRLLAAAASVTAMGTPVAAELLAIDVDPFAWLEEMT